MKSVEAWALVAGTPTEITLGMHERLYIYADRDSAAKRAQPSERVVRVKIEWEE